MSHALTPTQRRLLNEIATAMEPIAVAIGADRHLLEAAKLIAPVPESGKWIATSEGLDLLATINQAEESAERGLSAAERDVLAERDRHIARGFDAGHDDALKNGELLDVARCLAYSASVTCHGGKASNPPTYWPSPKNRGKSRRWDDAMPTRKALVQAAALLIAAIDQIDRSQEGVMVA